MMTLPRRRLLAGLWLAGLGAALLPLARSAPPARSQKHALLVGINTYAHPKLQKLKYAENDAAELATVLRKAGYKVVLLTGALGKKKAGLKPTRANIEARLKEVLGKCRRGDTVLVALAGHGLQFEGKKDAFFCPQDARPFAGRTDSLLSLQKVYNELDESFAAVKLLLVDACRDDPSGGRGVGGDTAPRPPSGAAALFSCRAGQRAFENDKLKHGVFFHFVLQGLRGEASNPDGEVTWDDLAAFVRRQVNRQTPKIVGGGARQTPHERKDIIGEPPLLLTVSKPKRPPAGRASVKRPPDRSITETLGIKMVSLRPGTFLMGSGSTEKDRFGDEPQHQVEITRPFAISAHPITVGQFRRFVAETGYRTDAERTGDGGFGYDAATRTLHPRNPKYSWRQTGWLQTERHPVVNVSWNDAGTFCDWLSKKEKRPFRLPTEAEWEYACRAGTSTRFWSGNGDESLRGVANLADRSAPAVWGCKWAVGWDDGHPFTAPVGSFKANPWGLFDMHGNVWQWCADWYHKDYYKMSPKKDPRGPDRGVGRVLRGGSWGDPARGCRAAQRLRHEPGHRDYHTGFRVVCVGGGRR
jgi:formylglycine-generating enzyme required for sulfatase activity